jgi:hypothetical protein
MLNLCAQHGAKLGDLNLNLEFSPFREFNELFFKQRLTIAKFYGIILA